MENNYLISPGSVVFLLGISIIGFYLYKKFGPHFKSGNSDNISHSLEESQQSYTKKPSQLLLSAKEKLEMSWKFLYEITETVINKFSTSDKQEIISNGSTLYNAGMRYEHVIDYAVNQESQKLYEQKIAATSQDVDSAPQGQAR
jgi:hypothetical protein